MPSVAKCTVNNSNMSSDTGNTDLVAIFAEFLVPI